MKAFLDRMTLDDIPDGNLKKLAVVIGISMVKELITKYPTMIVRIPKNLSTIYCRRYVEKHFNGSNHDQIALDLGVNVRTVFRHLNAKAPDRPKEKAPE